jgi:acyl-CoA synthetase (AMP-forming)/AMP-acid ligase II
MGDNLTKIIGQWSTLMPSTDAVIEMKRGCMGRTVVRRRLSFKVFDRRIDQYAAKFQGKGIEKGSRVLMLLRPGIEMMCTFFALIRIGAIPILIDSGVGLREIIRLGKFSKPGFIIVGGLCTKWLLCHRTLGITGKVITVGRFFAKCRTPTDVLCATDPEDVVTILFTSGSTGSAKGVVYKYRNFADQLDKLRLTYQLVPSVKDVTLLPVFTLFNPMFGRTSIIPDMDFSCPARFRPRSIVKTMVKHRVTSSFGAPILWNKIAEYCLECDIKLHHLTQIFLAGVSATARTLEKIQSIAPNAKIFTPYGATECLPVCSISAEEILGEIQPLQENGAGTCIGPPVNGIEVKIITPEDGIVSTIDDHNLLPLGYTGEIVVAGNNVTECYDQLPEKTRLAKIYQDGKVWHRMGDLGFFDQMGRIWFCGRKTERIVTQDGEEYYPDCIEPLFHKHPDVDRAALIKFVKRGMLRPAIVILPKVGQYPFFFWQKWLFRRKLRNLAQRFPKTIPITHFFFCRKLPVDPRHNAKINREKLSKKFSH